MKRRKHKPTCAKLRNDHCWCDCGTLGTVEKQRAAWHRECAKRPGRRWRLLAQEPARTAVYGPDPAGSPRQATVRLAGGGQDIFTDDEFDELVVDHWLHVERMDKRDWWAQVGDARLWIHIDKSGDVTVTIERGEYGPVRGDTHLPIARVRGKPKH